VSSKLVLTVAGPVGTQLYYARRRYCVHSFAAAKPPGNPHKTDVIQQRNGSRFEKPKRKVRVLYRAEPVRITGPPTRAVRESVASPFALLLLPLRLVKKSSASASTSTSRLQAKAAHGATPHTPSRPEQQSIGARALPPELPACRPVLTLLGRLPPRLGSRPQPPRATSPPPVPESKILSPVPCFGSSGTLNFAGSAGLTATSLLLRAQISVGRHGVTRSVLSS
jgi:hypothetical protein